ncbi:MAG: endonuclease/exonuclease/phosphatase family metal-dependent hydrolase [Bacteroidia bacterium]|jgi:endonuclease/exonuclease/phosphatase family metal-dependent hydrolase
MSLSKLKKRELLDRFMLFLNILVLIALSITYLAGIISPEKFWPLAFMAMGYPIILAITAFFIVYWLLRRKWFLFLNIAFLVLKWDYVAATVQFNSKSNEVSAYSEGIKVMTYNVRLFDYYNWSNNKNTRHWMHNFLFNQQPNILCFQEFYHDKTGYFPTIDTLLKVNSLKHMHVENYTDNLNKKQLWGMATLSSYPIINKGKIDFEGTYGNLCLHTDLRINEDTVRVYNLHLQSIRLGYDGYAVLDELLSTKELTDVDGGKNVLRMMINAFQMRAKQVELVKAHMNKCPYPLILCGDFNDVPTSYAYQTIASKLQDSFSASGTGTGNTFVKIPFFRIDNILFSKDFTSANHTVHPYELSDHFAVSTFLSKKD